MTFTLIKDYTGLTYYGNIPNSPDPLDDRVEEFSLEESDAELLLKYFVQPMWYLVDSVLDDGDVDYFDKEKCAKMKPWLENELGKNKPERLKFLYEKLLDFVSRAIELETGVVIEL